MMTDDRAYIVDTNVFRYYANTNHQLVQPFWDAVRGRPDYSLYLCDEIEREFEVQSNNPFLMQDFERIRQELYPLMVETLQYEGSIEEEHILRLIASRLKYKYDLAVPAGTGKGDKRPIIYPAVSDARIILTAIANSCGIVTRNLKDFGILAVFGYDVWDPTTGIRVNVDLETMKEIEGDAYIRELVVKLGI